MKIEIEVPDLPPEAAGDYEIMPELCTGQRDDYELCCERGVWQWYHVTRAESRYQGVVARRKKPKGLAFLALLPVGTVFAYEGSVYSRWLRGITFLFGHPVCVIIGGEWRWCCDEPLEDICADNCEVLWPKELTQ